MNANVLRPEKRVKRYKNVIFLAGPIQGAPDWQEEAINIIETEYTKIKNPDYKIACPRRLSGIDKSKDFNYNLQVDWETFYLNQAAENGVILFWLAKKIEYDLKRDFSQTSRFELGEWVTKHQQNNNIQIVVGIEPGFSGEKYIRKRLKKDCPLIPIFDDLHKTCIKAIALNL